MCNPQITPLPPKQHHHQQQIIRRVASLFLRQKGFIELFLYWVKNATCVALLLSTLAKRQCTSIIQHFYLAALVLNI